MQTDLALAVLWLAVLAFGVGTVTGLRALGLPATYARDLLHVGAGLWVVGWPWWHGPAVPLTIVSAAVVAVAAVPVAATRFDAVGRFHRSVAGGDERYAGLVVYTAAFAVMTWLGLTGRPFPAAAALLALALGDGLGGLVGRRLGTRFYTAPLGKRKSLEGSAAVAVFAAVGVAIAAALFGADAGVRQIAVLGLVAAVAEGLAPRATDNAVVPAAVWIVATLV